MLFIKNYIMFTNINQRTATAMIRQSKNRLKELEKKIKERSQIKTGKKVRRSKPYLTII